MERTQPPRLDDDRTEIGCACLQANGENDLARQMYREFLFS